MTNYLKCLLNIFLIFLLFSTLISCCWFKTILNQPKCPPCACSNCEELKCDFSEGPKKLNIDLTRNNTELNAIKGPGKLIEVLKDLILLPQYKNAVVLFKENTDLIIKDNEALLIPEGSLPDENLLNHLKRSEELEKHKTAMASAINDIKNPPTATVSVATPLPIPAGTDLPAILAKLEEFKSTFKNVSSNLETLNVLKKRTEDVIKECKNN